MPAAPSASASVTAVPPRSELAILRDAQAALGRDPAAALLLVAEHERAWPAGALTQEREVLAVEGLVRLGRGPEARSRADAFGRRFPASPYRRRLEVVLDPANARAPAGGVDADHR